jgi:hypothetical protein
MAEASTDGNRDRSESIGVRVTGPRPSLLKQPYRTPRLRYLGTVRDLTLGSGQLISDVDSGLE